MRDRALDHLSPLMRAAAVEFLARMAEAGIPLLIVETFRSEADHQADLAAGRSWIARSKHQDGHAMDVCPYDTYQLHGPDKLQWDAGDPVWERIAVTAEKCGLKSGYRWQQRDCGHVELVT